MKKHISYPSIEQFRNVITKVNRRATWDGVDENGEDIFNPLKPKPILKFTGTVKLHGSNASVCYNDIEGIWAQSRENIIDIEKDNAGFAAFVESNRESFIELFNKIKVENNLDLSIYTISIFGEWAGPRIQRAVAISEIPAKSMFIFGCKISKLEDSEFEPYWIDSSSLKKKEKNIFNIEDFKTYEIDIDFNMPTLSQNKLIEMTIEVENECPVGKEFGISGVGEGIVFSANFAGQKLMFKSKGEKHSISKVKTLNSVDVEKLNSITEFVNYAVTENRFNQGIEKVFGEEKISISKIADLMRWIINDITKEEADTLIANNLEAKETNKYISTKVKNMFMVSLDKEAGL